MIVPDLLEILCCPETRQSLTLAQPALIERLNQQIGAGTLRNRAGQVISEKLESGLVRVDGKVVYPIRGNIPVMLLDGAISLNQGNSTAR